MYTVFRMKYGFCSQNERLVDNDACAKVRRNTCALFVLGCLIFAM